MFAKAFSAINECLNGNYIIRQKMDKLKCKRLYNFSTRQKIASINGRNKFQFNML